LRQESKKFNKILRTGDAGPDGAGVCAWNLVIAMKGSKAGLIGVTVPAFHRPVPYLLFQISALGCSVVAFRSSKKWLALIGVSVFLTVQALLAAIIEG
jgi:hypothetical protein